MKTAALALLFVSLVTASFAADEITYPCETLAGWQKTGAWQVAGGVKLSPANDHLFVAESGTGVLMNGPAGKSVDLVTTQEFGDVEVHIEFCVAKKSNAGVYFNGRYEVQIYDSFGVITGEYAGIDCGSIYAQRNKEGRFNGHPPKTNASKPAGEWQSFDVIFRAPRVDAAGKKTANAKFEKVIHNGTVVHENVEVLAPTSGGYGGDEKATGPLRLQGDHGPIAYRNLRIRPL